MKWKSTFIAAAIMILASQVCHAEKLNAYAAPSTWGAECPLKGHLSAIAYTVSYKAVGKTKVVGRVTYVDKTGKEVTQEFNESITFTTGNLVGQPKLQFMGVPTGSAVTVDVKP